MKSIIVNFKDSYSVELNDDDDRDTEKYAENLSKILENNNVTILHATTGSLIVRPNEVTSILVSEEEEIFFDETSGTEIELEPEVPPKEEIQEDIITD